MSVIVAQGLRKRYDDVEAVAGIDLVVDEVKWLPSSARTAQA